MSSVFLRALWVVTLATFIGLSTACTFSKVDERQQQRDQAYNALQGRLEWLAANVPLDGSVSASAPYQDLLHALRELRCLDTPSPLCPPTPN